MVAPCKASYDPSTAKDMLLMAANPEEQQVWVGRLLKKIQKSGYKASSTLASSGGAGGSMQTLQSDSSGERLARGSPKDGKSPFGKNLLTSHSTLQSMAQLSNL